MVDKNLDDIEFKKLNEKPLCPKCFNIPIITINKENIEISCNCSYYRLETIEKYMKQIHLLNKQNKGHKDKLSNSKCDIHEKTKTFFCDTCIKYLCPECKSQHNISHQMINLLEFSSNNNISKIKENLKEVEKYLKEYYTDLKNKYQKEIQDAYETGKTRNKKILNLLNLLINNIKLKEINNYNLIKSISNNTPTCTNEFNPDNSNIFDFFKNNTIIARIPYSIENKIPISHFNIETLKNVVTIKENAYDVNDIIVLSDGRIASCAENIIKIFDPKNSYICDLTIKTEHTECISSLVEISDNRIISSSIDGTMKVFKIEMKKYQNIETINGHSLRISKVISLPNNRIASSSWDHRIKIWNSNSSFEFIQKLQNNEKSSEVISMLLMSDKTSLVSSLLKNQIEIWNIENYELLREINDIPYSCQNSLIELSPIKVAIGDDWNCITIVNILNGTKEKEIKEETLGNTGDITCLLLLKNNHLIGGTSQGTLFEIDLVSHAIIKKEGCHDYSITSIIYLPNNEIVTGSEDNSIKIWT